jgi:hypothetical protein
MKPSTFFSLIALFLGLSLFNCAGTPSGKPEAGYPNTRYPAGGPVFTGVSNGRYLSKDRALTLALQDAARRVSFFHSVEAVIESSEIYNPRFRISQVQDKRKLIYDTDYEKYLRLLEFDPKRDVYEEHGALFVHAVYTGETEGTAGYRYGARSGKPLWIENPPAESGGLFYAVGFAGSRLSHKDTVIASYEDAVYALVKNNFSKTYTSQQADENTLLDTSLVLVSGVVKGFHVLETWRDPKSGAVWTLAAAREVNRKREE